MKQISCVYCSSVDLTLFLNVPPYSYYRCTHCNLIFRYPQTFKIKQNKELYGDKALAKEYFEREWYWREVNNKILKEILKYIQKGRLLDIGSSYGLFLQQARENGFVVEGCELEKEASNVSSKKYRIVPKNLSFEELAGKNYNVITLLDVLEHLPDIKKVFPKLRSMLTKNGIVVVKVPNSESLMFESTKKEWKWLLPDVHLYQFSISFLQKAFTQNGFEFLSIHTFDDKSEFAYNMMDIYQLSKDDLLEKLLWKSVRNILLGALQFSFLWEKKGKGGAILMIAQKV